jgi:hypothetical protein
MPHVKGHYRKGRWVRPRYRRSPGVGVGAIIAVVFVLLIIAKLNGA